MRFSSAWQSSRWGHPFCCTRCSRSHSLGGERADEPELRNSDDDRKELVVALEGMQLVLVSLVHGGEECAVLMDAHVVDGLRDCLVAMKIELQHN